MQLSKHFTLSALTVTKTGLENKPGEKEIKNLKRLCGTILEPLWDDVGEIIVNSGFRSKEVNTKIGGSSTSQHPKGEAADIEVPGMEIEEIVKKIRDLKLPFHQLIDEHVGNDFWVHVSIAPDGVSPKRQVLTCRLENGKKVYKQISIG